MKTVGEIIHNERTKKEISIERLSQLTKIDIKYLEAIERDDYSSLPSETFIKGFIRNISLRLERNPDELVAIFRRDFRQQETDKPNLVKISPKRRKINFEPASFITYVVGFLIFLFYLAFQFRAVLKQPELKIQSPLPGSVITSPVEVSGITNVNSLLSIGDDLKIRSDNDGKFNSKVSLPLGETTLTIQATSRFGRTSTKEVSFTVISK